MLSTAQDVFSFSVVMWELLTWALPWRDAANPWQVRAEEYAQHARICVALQRVGCKTTGPPGLRRPPSAATAACAPALLQVAKHVLDGGRLPMPDLGQLPGPGGNFQAPGPAGGIQLYLALMARCWAQQPEDRPTFTDIIASLRCAGIFCV